MEKLQDVTEQALQLTDKERLQLAKDLLESVEVDENPSVEDHWVALALDRDRDFETGKTKGVPSDVMFASVREKLNAHIAVRIFHMPSFPFSESV